MTKLSAGVVITIVGLALGVSANGVSALSAGQSSNASAQQAPVKRASARRAADSKQVRMTTRRGTRAPSTVVNPAATPEDELDVPLDLMDEGAGGGSQGESVPGFTAKPVMVWASRDAMPVSGPSATAALAAFDAYAGVESVKFIFSEPVQIDGESRTSFVMGEPVWADLHGYGESADYWKVDFSTDGIDEVVVDAFVHTRDGVTHEMPGERLVRVVASPQIVYLDATRPDDSGGGTSWQTAKKTLAGALLAAGASADVVLTRPGSYPLPTTVQSRLRQKYLRVVAEAEGVVFVGAAGNVQNRVSSWLSFKGITFDLGGGLRTTGGDHLDFENCRFNFAVRRFTQGRGGPHLKFCSMDHISLIASAQTKGFRGPVFATIGVDPCYDAIISGFSLQESGTGATPNGTGMLIERYTATNNAASAEYPPSTHFDFLHPFSKNDTPFPDRQIIRYNQVVFNGNAEHGHNYNFCLLEDGSRNMAIYNNISYNVQSLQMIAQVEGDMTNVSFVHNTFLAQDEFRRGLYVSNGGASLPFVSADFVFRNNMTHQLSQQRQTQPLESILGDLLLGPNVYTMEPYFYEPREDELIVPGPSGLGLVDLGSGDLRPTPGSVADGAGAMSDVRFDFNGNPRSGTPSLGALEP